MKRMNALFASRCAACGLRIEAGESIEYRPDAPKGQRALHAACADRDTRQPEPAPKPIPQFDIFTPQQAPQKAPEAPPVPPAGAQDDTLTIAVYVDNSGRWGYAPASVVTPQWRADVDFDKPALTLFDVLEMIAEDASLPEDYKLLFDPEANNVIPGITGEPLAVDDDLPF